MLRNIDIISVIYQISGSLSKITTLVDASAKDEVYINSGRKYNTMIDVTTKQIPFFFIIIGTQHVLNEDHHNGICI